jgi:uncharacterized membrane protein YphA (DoxX/SURF4 family)
VTAEAAPRGGFLTSPWLTTRTQILLGALFAAAALPKIGDPPSFAHMIYNYRIVPGVLVNAMALVMPWLELLCGVALILGIWRRAAVAYVGAMLLVFIVAISVNLVRDNAVNCGCFDVHSADKSHDQLMNEMKFVVVRDVGMLILVAQILAATRRREDGDPAEALRLA